MKRNRLHIGHVLAIWLLLSTTTQAEILFDADFEQGLIPYLGSGNKHPGGGYFTFLGGHLTNPLNPGDGTSEYTKFQNVIISAEADAQNSLPGSQYSLKTHYAAGNTNSYQRNTTIIEFPERDKIHIRWYQKWSRTWIWPDSQHKLCKIKTRSSTSSPGYWSQNFKMGGSPEMVLTHASPNRTQFETYVYAVRTTNIGDFRQPDSINNGLGPGGTDAPFKFELDRWYSIEVMVDGSDPNTNNGEYKYWVDGVLVFHLKNAVTRFNGSTGLGMVELQHVAQFASNSHGPVDMPTYMDNIVISTEYIGPKDCIDCVQSMPPAQLK